VGQLLAAQAPELAERARDRREPYHRQGMSEKKGALDNITNTKTSTRLRTRTAASVVGKLPPAPNASGAGEQLGLDGVIGYGITCRRQVALLRAAQAESAYCNGTRLGSSAKRVLRPLGRWEREHAYTTS